MDYRSFFLHLSRLGQFISILCCFGVGKLHAEAVSIPNIIDTIVIGSGAGTSSTAVNQNKHRLYVANARKSTVTVGDSRTDGIIDTIAIDSTFNISSGVVVLQSPRQDSHD